jgi:hypothetical protein
MTLDEIRLSVRNLLHDYSSEVTARFDATNYLLDFFINNAAELVVLDLCESIPEQFMKTENISLDTTKTEYALTTEFLRIWGIRRNVSGENPTLIPYVDYNDEAFLQTVGETKDEPDGWTLKGNSVVFFPKASANKTNYAIAYLIVPEAVSIPSAGPTYIPRMAQRLIPIVTCVLISKTFGAKKGAGWEDMYAYALKRVIDVLGGVIQQQPKFVKGSAVDKMRYDSQDPAFFDKTGFFD